jgi:hypothetical protein
MRTCAMTRGLTPQLQIHDSDINGSEMVIAMEAYLLSEHAFSRK